MNNYQYHIYPSMRCSLSCQHCFIDKSLINSKETMTEDQFKIVADKFSSHFKDSKAQFAEITIIGGEPTLIPSDFYHEVIPYLRQRFEETGKGFMVSIVTNLLHLPNLERMRDLFDLVVTSYEPARFTSANMVASIDRKKETWEKNLNIYLESGKPLSISLATTQDVIDAGTDLLDKFLDKGIRFIQLNTIVPEGKIIENEFGNEFYESHVSVRTDDLSIPLRNRRKIVIENAKIIPDFKSEAEYLIAVTEWLYKKRMDGIDVNVYPVNSFISGVIYNHEIDDISCCINKGMNVRFDGAITGCASEIGSKNMLSYGNIYKDNVQDIANSEAKEMHSSMGSRLDKECRKCEFLSNCYGSCMLRARFWNAKGDKANCHGLKPFMEYIRNHQERLSVLLNDEH
ncbi:SPASM domain-containing protein [Vibrio parahaemolyticus O5:K30]|nr:SPASM domain-containing protein [Vibrio parahaemolyticus O5:K30]